MTERAVVRFKVYTKTRSTVAGGVVFPYNEIDFNIGGTFDTTTYKYTIENAGTYLIGVSYNKNTINNNGGSVDIQYQRNNTTYNIHRSQSAESVANRTISACIMYKFEVGDNVFVIAAFGNPATNTDTYTTDDIKNSFWGIRLDY
jgi:hypothetical protein